MPRKSAIQIENLDPFSPVTKEALSIEGSGKQSSRYAIVLHPQTSKSANDDGTGVEVVEEIEPVEVGVVSNEYKLIQNLDVVNIAEEILRSTNLQWTFENHIFDGRRFMQRYRIPDLNLERTKGDVIALTLDVFNSYDGSSQFGFAFNALRLVCLNGMTVASKLGGFKMNHFENPDRFERELEQARAKVLGMGNNLRTLGPAIDRMNETPLDVSSIQRFLSDTQMPRQYIPELIQGIEMPTEWGIYNAATRVLTEANSFAAEAWNGRVSDYMFNRFGENAAAAQTARRLN